MTVLVAAASKYGATAEIAEAIGRALRESGVSADVRPVEQVGDLSGYTGVVLGSAVYLGRWLEPARRFVEEHADELAARPTWLFSSGPVGDPPKPEAGQAVQIEPLMAKTKARDHRLFAGKIDKGKLGFGERADARPARRRGRLPRLAGDRRLGKYDRRGDRRGGIE